MRMKDIARIAGTAALLASGVSLAGCNDNAHPQGWSNQWYRKGHTPEEVAAYRRKHPDHAYREPETAPQDDSTVGGGGGMGGPGN